MKRKEDEPQPQEKCTTGKSILVMAALASLLYGCLFILYYIFVSVESGVKPTSHLFTTFTDIVSEVFKFIIDSNRE